MKKLSTFFATVLVSVLLIGSTSFAQTATWNGANSSDWSVNANWTPSGAPTALNAVVIPGNGETMPVLTAANNSCASLTINGSANLDLAGKNFTSTGAVTINASGILFSSAGAGSLTMGGINIAGTLNATNITNIQVGGSWTLTGTYTVGTSSVVQFDGTSAQTINSATTFPNLTINATGPVALGANITVSGDLTLTAGNFNAQTFNITLGGSSGTPIAIGAGTFTAGTGSTVSYQGSNAAQALAGLTYTNLDLNRSGVTFTAAAGSTVAGILSISAGKLSMPNGTVLNLGGNFTNNGGVGTFVSTGASTINCYGASSLTQSIAGVTYNSLNITTTKAVGVTLSGTAAVTNLTLAGNFNDGGFQLSGTAAGTLVFTSGTLKLGAGTSATTFPYAGITSFGAGTVEYASTAPQTVSNAPSYFGLKLDTGTKNPQGSFTVVNVTNASTFVGGAFTTTVTGWWLGATGSCTSGTVIFAGGAAQTVDGSTFYNLTINSGQTLTPSAALTVNGNFTITSGTFVAGAFNHTILGNWADAGSFTNTSSTITFSGNSAITEPNTSGFNNFAVAAASTVTPGAGFTVSGTFSNAGVFVAGTNVYTVVGNWASPGTFTKGTSTVAFTGTNTVDGTSFNNLTISGTTTPTVNMVATGLVTITGTGTLLFGNFAATGTGTIELMSGGTISTADPNGFNATPATTGSIQMSGRLYDNGANYIYNGTANQFAGTAISTNTVGNITINNSATSVTMNGTGYTTVGGTLTLTSGAFSRTSGVLQFVNTGAATILITGGSLTFAPTGGSSLNVVYNISADRTTSYELPIASRTGTITNLTINDTGGGVTLEASARVTVYGALTLTSGVFHANGGLTLGNAATTTNTTVTSTSFVDGLLGWLSDGTGNFDHKFPIGTGTDSRPVRLQFAQTTATTNVVYTVQMFNNVTAVSALTLPGDNSLGKVSENRYYAVTGGQAAGFVASPGLTVTLTYATNDGVSDATTLRMATATTSATAWTNLAGSGSAVPSGQIFNSTAATTVGYFILATAYGSNNILPVELTSFTGVSNENNVTLKWTTATEVNSFKFAVERSLDKVTWVNVATVQAAGNSNAPKNYTLTDKNVTGGTSFNYRLMMVNPSGVLVDFGKIITVSAVPTKFDLSQNYPNPFNPSTTIKFSVSKATVVTLKVYNMIGQEVVTLVNEQKEIGFYSLTWNGRNNFNAQVASGVYIYRIVAGDFVSVKKMNLLK